MIKEKKSQGNMNMKLAVKLLRVLGGSLVSLGHNRRRHYKETHTAKKKRKKSSFFFMILLRKYCLWMCRFLYSKSTVSLAVG